MTGRELAKKLEEAGALDLPIATVESAVDPEVKVYTNRVVLNLWLPVKTAKEVEQEYREVVNNA